MSTQVRDPRRASRRALIAYLVLAAVIGLILLVVGDEQGLGAAIASPLIGVFVGMATLHGLADSRLSALTVAVLATVTAFGSVLACLLRAFLLA